LSTPNGEGRPTSDAVFVAEGGTFVPTAHATGPWSPSALHGGAPAALLTEAFERFEPGAGLRIGRLSFEFLRPIPSAPLTISTRLVRPGRRVQELAAEITAAGETVCRASALRVREVPDELGVDGGKAMPGPNQGREFLFALDDVERASFAASAMEMRGLEDPGELGPARVWMRLRMPLVDGGEPPSPLARLAATADFGNGISAALPFERYLFINADLSIHLHRQPRGEWIGLDARTLLAPGGSGLAESVLHDLDGPVGRGFQTLVVQAR
jgi:hypothetical protein